MDYEKKYKEALVNMQELYNSMKYMSSTDALHTTTALERAFPELKESKDEKIRNVITLIIKGIRANVFEEQGISKEDAITYLEKQSKSKFEQCIQKGDKIVTNEDGTHFNVSQLERAAKKEPKFKVGDWVVREYTKDIITINQVVGVKRINDEHFGYTLDDGTYFSGSWESSYHLWTIQDAKDGDVLAGFECLVLFKKLDGLNIRCYCTYHFMNNPSFYVDTLQNKNAFHPATKEQRDLLFQKMKEAGYEWNAEKKELKKIHVIDEGKAEMDYCFTKMMNGEKVSPTWSEEDEENLNQLHKLIVKKAYEEYEIDTEDETLWGKYAILDNWLKSLKGRVQPNQWKPSEEQLNALNALNLNGDISYVGQQKQLIELYEQLEKL